MKKLLALITLAAITSASAQTFDEVYHDLQIERTMSRLCQPPTLPAPPGSTNDVTPPPFYDTAMAYFTSFNTNLTTLSLDRGSVWAGADYVSGVNVSSHLGFSYNLGSSTNGNGFRLESVTRNAGIAGTILSQQAGAGYHVTVFDARISASLAGGYDWNARAGFIAPTLDIRKAMTQRTFAGLRLDVPIMFRHGSGNYVPRVGIFTGFTF